MASATAFAFPHYSLLFAGLAGLIFFALAIAVILRRAKTQIDLGDGGDTLLLRRIRAHGNFAESVPLALILLALLEMRGLTSSGIIALGTLLMIARVSHAVSMLTNNAPWSRRGGTALTLIVISAQTVLCIALFASN